MRIRYALPLALLLVAAPAQAQIGPDVVMLPPEEAFAAVERILLEEEHLAADEVELRADSALTVRLMGGLRLGPENRARLHADGLFEVDARLRLVSDGARMVGGRSAEVGFDEDTPAALREALAVGFTRMGLLHNVARLFAGAAPDHAEGGVTEWVEVHGFEWLPEQPVSGYATRPLRFTVRVDGTDTAEATLFLHEATGLPLLRRQTVTFATGRMVVEEYYSGWINTPPSEEAMFAVEPGPFE